MKRSLSVILAAVLLASVPILDIAIAPPAEATAYCQRYSNWPCNHWRRSWWQQTAYASFNDHTGWLWPVSTAASKWDEGTTKLNVSYRYNSCGINCMHVYEYYAADGNFGVVYWQVYSNGHFVPNTVVLYLNNYYGQYASYGVRWMAACHELGHGLGLNHNWPAGWGSCMSIPIDGSGEWPLQEDFNLLNTIYGHSTFAGG